MWLLLQRYIGRTFRTDIYGQKLDDTTAQIHAAMRHIHRLNQRIVLAKGLHTLFAVIDGKFAL